MVEEFRRSLVSKQSRPRIHQFIDGIMDRFVEVLLAELDTDL
jgi:hypothetical protein